MYLNLHIKVYIPGLIEWPFIAIALWYRRKKYGYTFRRIKLPKGKYAIVDVEDYKKLTEYDWQCVQNRNERCYAVRFNAAKVMYMHRVIINAPKGKIVDHKNRQGLDNRRANLRVVTAAQNSYNRRKIARPCSSKYKGVSRVKRDGRWVAIIRYKGVKKFLGYFDDEIKAANRYDKAAKELHGEFAFLNLNQPPSLP